MGFELFPSAPPAGHLATPDTPRSSPQLALHTLQSLSLVHSRTASPQPLPPRRRPGAFPLPDSHRSESPSSFQPVNRRPAPVSPPAPSSAPPSPRPRGFAPCPSPLPGPALPRLPARCSLGLCSPSRYSLRPRCPFYGHPARFPLPTQQAAPFTRTALTQCRSTLPAASCPNRPLSDFPPPLYRCRWHPV